jgi:hypothetical protein
MLNGKWSKDNFVKFDQEHPEIYEMFERFSKQASGKRSYFSAKAIMHRIRWETLIGEKKDYKIDDGWISHYARKFMELNPHLDGFFQTRKRQKSYH